MYLTVSNLTTFLKLGHKNHAIYHYFRSVYFISVRVLTLLPFLSTCTLELAPCITPVDNCDYSAYHVLEHYTIVFRLNTRGEMTYPRIFYIYPFFYKNRHI